MTLARARARDPGDRVWSRPPCRSRVLAKRGAARLVRGNLGVLIRADLLNVGALQGFGATVVSIGSAGLLGPKRGLFVLVVDEIEEEGCAMNTLWPERSSQEITRSPTFLDLAQMGGEMIGFFRP